MLCNVFWRTIMNINDFNNYIPNIITFGLLRRKIERTHIEKYALPTYGNTRAT